MNIDVSIRAEALTSAMRNRVAAIPICVGQSLTGFFEGMVVDRVEIDPPTLSRANAQLPIRLANGSEALIWGHRLRATFVVRALVATQDALEQAGPNVPQTIPLQFQVQFDLSGELTVDDEGNVLGAGVRTTFVGKDAALPDPDLDAQVDTLLTAAGQFAPIDLSALTEALDASASICNIGLAFGDGRMVVRIEVGSVTANAQAVWAAFFSTPPNWLGERDWAIFIDEALICQAVEARLSDEFAKSVAKGDIEVLEQPSATWLGWMGIPLVQAQAYIDAVDACPNGLDIGVELVANTLMSLVDGPALQLSTNFEWNLIDSDVLLCGITMGVWLAMLGAILGAVAGPVGAGIGAVVGMVGSVVAISVVADYISPPTKPPPPECQQTEADEDHITVVCTQPFELASNALLGDLVPDQLAADANGLMLRGSSSVPPLNTELIVNVKQFVWESRLNCNTKQVDVTLAGGAMFACLSPAPLTRCGTEVLDDPLDFFEATLYSNAGYDQHLHVGVDWSKYTDYLADPYPCRVICRTSRGTRLVNLGQVPPPLPEPDQIDLITAIAAHCLKALDPRGRIHALWRLWLPDPAPDMWISQHRWDVAIADADPGAVIRLVDKAGATLAEKAVDSGGATRLRLVRSPASMSEQNGLTVQVELPEAVGSVLAADNGSATDGGPAADAARELPRLAIGQTQLVRSRALQAPGPVVAMARVRGTHPLVALVTDGWLVTFGRQPGAGLGPTAQLRLPGVRGVIDDPKGLVAFGEHGLVRFTIADSGSLEYAGDWRLEECARTPVRDANLVGDVTAVLTDDRLVLVRAGEQPRVLGVPPDAILADWGGRLAVVSAAAARVDLYNLQRKLPTSPYVSVEIPPRVIPVDTGRRRVRPVGTTVFSLHAGEDGWSAPQARVRPPDWYDTVVTLGPWLARLEPDGSIGAWRASRPMEAKAPFLH